MSEHIGYTPPNPLLRDLRVAIAELNHEREKNGQIQAELVRLRDTAKADDERLGRAGERVGIEFGCDTAEHMADEILRLREERQQEHGSRIAWQGRVYLVCNEIDTILGRHVSSGTGTLADEEPLLKSMREISGRITALELETTRLIRNGRNQNDE